MHHALRGELLHHAPGDEFVVLGHLKPPRDGLEGLNESGEISELVDCVGFGLRQGDLIVSGAQFHQCGGENGALEMQMKLGLGEPADKGLDFAHTLSLAVLEQGSRSGVNRAGQIHKNERFSIDLTKIPSIMVCFLRVF